jgi:putative hydrolase of the HAD superfamily
VPDGVLHADGLRALVFDVDGTLYRQGPLRRVMLARLAVAYAAHPIHGWRTMRVLRAYRHAQEDLRAATVSGAVADAQIALTRERTGVDRDAIVGCVTRWMEDEPLRFLAKCLQPGVTEFLQTCRKRGLRLGVLSDYPADGKLRVLGLSGLFDVVVCAQAPEVNRFKPDPRGLLVVLERLGAARSESLYVGDRVDVDVPTAQAAGVRCAIVTGRRSAKESGSHIEVSGYPQLRDVLWP